MSSKNYYEQKIQSYSSEDLLQLWEEIENGATPGWEAGKAFECLVLRAFQLEGAAVIWPYSVWAGGVVIEQIDGVIFADGLACLIECKDVSEKVNIEPIAKLRYRLSRRPETVIGIMFIRGEFTEPTLMLERFTSLRKVLLWEGKDIAYALSKRAMRRGLIAKYRHCVERGFPDYSIIGYKDDD